MTKAKCIDRLELTRKHSNLLETHNNEKTQESIQHAFDIPQDFHAHNTGNICPRCGKPTLIHEASCERCPECGYDACAWNEV